MFNYSLCINGLSDENYNEKYLISREFPEALKSRVKLMGKIKKIKTIVE